MSNRKHTDTITLGAQTGDPESSAATVPHFMPLRQFLAQLCKGPYSTDIDEFAFVLRIDGDLWYWNFEGCDKLRLSKKHRYITVDIGVPKSRWTNISAHELKIYLADCVQQGLKMMIQKLRMEKLEIDEDRLLSDFNRVRDSYLQVTDDGNASEVNLR